MICPEEMLPYIGMWAKAFLLTCLVEVPIAAWLLRDGALWRRGAVALFAQIMSHPAVWFLWMYLPVSWNGRVVAAEGWAFASEALFYFVTFERLRLVRAGLVSLAANGASFGVGLLLEPYLY